MRNQLKDPISQNVIAGGFAIKLFSLKAGLCSCKALIKVVVFNYR